MHRRQAPNGPDRCQSGIAYDPAAYNLPLHIGSVFVVLAVSSLACAFPLLVLRFPRLRIPARVLFVVRHFGTGVLLATAFVHLLPTAFISLGDPCLSPFWTNDYPAMPGAIALFAIFIIAGIEMTFSPEKRCCAAPVEASGVTTPSSSKHRVRVTDEDECCADVASQTGVSPAVARPILASEGNRGRDHSDLETGGHDEKTPLTTEQEHRKAFLQCVLLEMGILFHSVFIGMNLSVSSGREFVILFIAIVFHRKWCLPCPPRNRRVFVEELLESKADSEFRWNRNIRRPCSRRKNRRVEMAGRRRQALAHVSCVRVHVSFSCPSRNSACRQMLTERRRTPIGQAIGLALHSSYSPDSESGLLLVGIMNAISAGLLIYASLTELLVQDFLSDRSWRTLRGLSRVGACSWVVLGAVAMSLVGAWA
jgi:zinc transporter 1/2/3